jgi:hypothetical protein
MKILGKEIDFDLNDAENIDRLQELDNNYAEKIKESNKLTEQCKIYKEFFNKAIGEGTSELLFDNKNNYMEIIKAYNEFIGQIEEKLNEFIVEAEKTKQKYERYK